MNTTPLSRVDALTRIRSIVADAVIVPGVYIKRDVTGAVVGRCAIGQLLHAEGVSDERLAQYDTRKPSVYGLLNLHGVPELKPYADAIGVNDLQAIQTYTDGDFVATSREERDDPVKAKERALTRIDSMLSREA